MQTTGVAIPLQREFEDIVEAIHRSERFTCFHKVKGTQCGNPLSKVTHAKLALKLISTIELLQNSDDGIETFLEEASLLVMCVRDHQDQATIQFKEWSARIPIKSCKLVHGGGNIERLSLTTTDELSKDHTLGGSSWRQRKADLLNAVDFQQSDSYSSPESPESSFDTDSDDSGFQTGHEDDLAGKRAEASSITETSSSSSSTEYATPQTPQKAAKPMSTDSGISMSFDRSDKAQRTTSIKERNRSESPSTGRGSRAKRPAACPPSRPAPTPVQPISLSIRTKSKFVLFDDPSKKLVEYIKKPLEGEKAERGGYIYAFQLGEGCAYTKIGVASLRKKHSLKEHDLALQASFDDRMRGLKEEWPNLKLLFMKPVPHVFRVEKLIHYHLEAGRMKEQYTRKYLDGGEPDHVNHIEWFNNSLYEIHTVVIAWENWINRMPYSEFDGKCHNLSLEWRNYLADIRVQRGRDYWLEWLCQHVPEIPSAIKKATLDNIDEIEDQRTIQGHGSFARNSANGINFEIKRARTNLL